MKRLVARPPKVGMFLEVFLLDKANQKAFLWDPLVFLEVCYIKASKKHGTFGGFGGEKLSLTCQKTNCSTWVSWNC